jgi:TolB-like protein
MYAPWLAAIRPDPRIQALIAEHTAAIERDRAGPVASAPVDHKSVAVLAFANLSSDKEQEFFSDGISEELLNVLAKVPGLKVSARTSAFYFKGKQVPMAEIATQLGVAYVSRAQRAGDGPITAQLIKAAALSEPTRDMKDMQDECAKVPR